MWILLGPAVKHTNDEESYLLYSIVSSAYFSMYIYLHTVLIIFLFLHRYMGFASYSKNRVSIIKDSLTNFCLIAYKLEMHHWAGFVLTGWWGRYTLTLLPDLFVALLVDFNFEMGRRMERFTPTRVDGTLAPIWGLARPSSTLVSLVNTCCSNCH